MEHDSINQAAGQDESTVAERASQLCASQTTLPRGRVADIAIRAAPGLSRCNRGQIPRTGAEYVSKASHGPRCGRSRNPFGPQRGEKWESQAGYARLSQ